MMEEKVASIRAGESGGQIWLLEHPPVYTAGTSAKSSDLLNPCFPVYNSGRGGEYTYHGPGQRVAYAMLDLKALFAPHPPDLRQYIHLLERWIIAALAQFGVCGLTRKGRVGVWVEHQGNETKIAAIGVRVRAWVAYHGICINLHPDLSHYSGIVPCGIKQYGVTSLKALGVNASMPMLDQALKEAFAAVFLPLFTAEGIEIS